MDITDKFKSMIEAFECDFSLALEDSSGFVIQELQQQISDGNKKLIADISLLKELSFGLRHGFLKIINCEDKQDDRI